MSPHNRFAEPVPVGFQMFELETVLFFGKGNYKIRIFSLRKRKYASI